MIDEDAKDDDNKDHENKDNDNKDNDNSTSDNDSVVSDKEPTVTPENNTTNTEGISAFSPVLD